AARRRGGQPWSTPIPGRPRPPARRLLATARASPKGRPAALARRGSSPALARGCRPRPALPQVGAATLAIGVAGPWQGGYQRARAAVTCIGAAAAQIGKEGLGHPLEKRTILPL
ncbi:hypothetical protein GW17_00062030, partial [Ensete ventricosum]